MGASKTVWEGGTSVEIIVAEEDSMTLDSLVFQVKATLLGLGYTEKQVENAFR